MIEFAAVSDTVLPIVERRVNALLQMAYELRGELRIVPLSDGRVMYTMELTRGR